MATTAQPRKPKVGEPIVFRESLDTELAPGLVQRLVYEEDESQSADQVYVVVFAYGDGRNEWHAKHHKGCAYAMTWCYPEEVE